MPAPSSNKRVRGLQVHRPFIFGSEAIPFDPANRPRDAPPDHTHKWRVFVRGVTTDSDITHWLRKVQFKLHDTYANSVRMVETPSSSGEFAVEETGWGEFEIALKFYFAPESNEKPQTLWHALKLHPYHGDIEKQKAERTIVNSICYEEVVFSEPAEQFYDILTGGAERGANRGKGAGAKSGKSGSNKKTNAEIPERNGGANRFSREEEGKELDRLGEAIKTVEKLIQEEKSKLVIEEGKLQELEKTEGKVVKKK